MSTSEDNMQEPTWTYDPNAQEASDKIFAAELAAKEFVSRELRI